MHILIIPSERFVTPEDPFGGIFQYHQAHALRRSGLQVGIVAPAPRSLRFFGDKAVHRPTVNEIENDKGILVYRNQRWGWIPGRIPLLSYWLLLKYGKDLVKRYISRHGAPDIVHAHNTYYAGAIGAFLKEKYNIPFIITEHSSMYANKQIHRWQNPFILRALRSADAKIAVSQHLGELLEAKYGPTVRPWEWIPNILEDRFENAELLDTRYVSENQVFAFLNIANLLPGKNQVGLLQSFAKKFKGSMSVQLRIGGDGPLRHLLEMTAANLGIANQVLFLGSLTREQVLSEMKACNVFVLSSDYETFGVVLIEALACGRPVIATSGSGPEDVVHKDNGLLVPPRNVEALAGAMQDMYQHFGRYHPSVVRQNCLARFSARAVVQQLMAVYRRALLQGNRKQKR